jgi:hypothetical protein
VDGQPTQENPDPISADPYNARNGKKRKPPSKLSAQEPPKKRNKTSSVTGSVSIA